jgi:uncharacterized protein
MAERTEMTEEQIKGLLSGVHTIAAVGLSADESKPSYRVANYLRRVGYHIVPVNPRATEIFGQSAYRDLPSIPEPVDVVQIFRPAEEAPAIVEQAIGMGAKVVWMQLGIVNETAAEQARAAGLQVVMDRCMMREHHRLLGRR